MSEKKLGIINPDEKLFSKRSKRRTGKTFDFRRHPPDPSYHKDASDIFKNILNMDLVEGKCNGTVFRFALRRKESELSATIYDGERVRELFQSFKEEGHFALLFLKSLANIEVYTRKKGSTLAELLFSFSITQDNNKQQRLEECNFMKKVEEAHNRSSVTNDSLVKQVTIHSSINNEGSIQTGTAKYIIVHYYGGKFLQKKDNKYITKQQAKDLGFIPLVGIAYQMSENKSTAGHIFCALPLPVIEEKSTGLPVHVNGHFALGPDRKDLKWPSPEQSASSDKEVSWNLFLLKKVLPAAYIKLFHHFKMTESQCTIVYNTLPDVNEVDYKWGKFAREVLSGVFQTECLWSDAIAKWISLKDACIVDKKRSGHEGASAFLKICCFPLAVISKHIKGGMKKCGVIVEKKSPKDLVRCIIENYDKMSDLVYQDRIDLLAYALEDPIDIRCLFDVPILPLEDGGFANPKRSKNEPLFLTSNSFPMDLVPGCEKNIIKTDMQEDLLKIMKEIAWKDFCQVTMLNERNIATLLKKTHIQENESQMIYATQELSTLPLLWFPKIWGHINKYGNLKDFEGLPLIPLATGNSCREFAVLEKESVFIYCEKNEENEVISLLRHLGCTIIKELPSYVLQNRSVFKRKYLYEYIDENLLQVISNLESKLGKNRIIRQFSEFNDKAAKLEFLRKVSHFSLKGNINELLISLPFIENTHNHSLVSVKDCPSIAPKELPDVMPQQMLLKIQNKTQRQFIEQLGGKELSKIEFIESILLPEIQSATVPGKTNKSMINYILASIVPSNNQDEWKTVIKALSSIQFVKSDDGKLYKPIELFRRCEKLKTLFIGEKGRFPSVGQNAEALILKNESDVSADDIEQCLGTICDMEEIQQAHIKVKCILEYLDCHSNLLQSERFISKLKKISWIPINRRRPDVYPDCLSWYGEEMNDQCIFCNPDEMVFRENSNLVGSVRAVIPNDVEGFTAIKLLKENSQLHNQDVIDQLLHVINNYNGKYRNKILVVLSDIYCFLQTKYNELTADQQEWLMRMNWILCGNCFVKPQQILLNKYSFDMQPYIYSLPQELQEVYSLLSNCGSATTIDKEKFIDILYSVKQDYQYQTKSQEQVDRDRNMCVNILTALGKIPLSEDDLKRILVPIRCEDTELLLEVSAQTVYSPMGGLHIEEESADLDEEEIGDTLFLHECMTEKMAKSLHIRTLTNKLIGAEDLGIFEEYGQHEPLTRRIKSILADYGDGLAIVKELIQNADDAGAKEVKLLYDERQNEDKRKYLIDPGMKDVQGPALWAYNDAQFTKEDFENIVKLSGATKEDKRDKIGKFGLGFNAVYNITDVPSFISDNQLVILDPHATYLGNAIKSKSRPGVKIPLGPRRNRLRRFEDQIKIYDGVFGMDASIGDSYRMFEGTLFRFPLRTKRQARMSEIKDLFYSKDEMKKLIRKFSLEANRLLMFTQNVCTIDFFHLEEGASNAENINHILHVSKKIFTPNVNHKHLEANDCQSFDIMNQSSLAVECKVTGKENSCCTNHFRHVIGINTVIKEGLKDLIEIQSKDENETWFIHSSIDEKECMDMALLNVQLNPVASVAVRIDMPQNSRSPMLMYQERNKPGYFYCFLPLPIPNGLNVHINSTFALSKDRKSFQEKSEDDKMYETQEAIWNRKLMSGPVSSAYIGLLNDLTIFLTVKDEAAWYNLWPHNDAGESKVCSYKQELIRSFYSSIINKRACVFPNPRAIKEWLYWTQIMTIEDSVKDRMHGNVIEEMMEEVASLFLTEKVIVHIPQQLLSTIQKAGFKAELSKIVLSFSWFFSKLFMPNVERLRTNIREEILLFAIHNHSYDPLVVDAIKGFECIPTQPNGQLRKPTDLVKPVSKAASLFELDEEVFPLQKFEHCYAKLMEFGMLSDDIPWELLLRRAQTVNGLGASKPKVAEKRVKKVIQLVKEKMHLIGNEVPDLCWKSIAFLPVKQRPPNWMMLDWEGIKSGKQFASAEEMYPNRFENVIGCHKLIIDNGITGMLSPAVERLLGVRTQCNVDDIIQQVYIISECIKGKEKRELPTMLPQAFDMIYSKLSEDLSKEPKLEAEIKERFKNKRVILTDENTLVKSEQVAFHLKYNARPYLYELCNKFAIIYHELMVVLGVREIFSIEDYTRTLISLKNNTKGNPLSDPQLDTVRNLLESISKLPAPYPDNIFLPAKDKLLWQKELVAVKESVWMKSLPSKRYLHDSIPPKLALSLGAKTERSHSIASQSRGLPFGQHEKLTVRLKRIMEAYPSQIQILYEILQNADDAGASEVKFVLDKRHHTAKNVFGDAWKPLQGPALLVFNDAPFTQRDIEGIQNLGEGSKSDDCQKTGQYGIGFNVVYHVTDAPCLLTKVKDVSVLCIFDPHACFLEECSDAEPGRMFTDGRNYLKNNFPDIYTTFLPEFLTNEESATLRLPLRTSDLARNSSIKQQATTTVEIQKMFQSFKEKGPEAIVFLRNVKSVELFIIEEDRHPLGAPHRIFSVHANMASDDKRALSLFNEDFNSLSSSMKNRSEPIGKFQTFKWEVTLRTMEDRRKDCGNKWKIFQKCASVNSQDFPPTIAKLYKNGQLPLIPVGGIAYKTDGSLIDAKVYCLLPLTVTSSLPVHMNGKFILDYESRRRLCYISEGSFQNMWNCYVIEHCIIPCYVELIRTLALERNFAFRDVDPFELLKEVFMDGGSHPKQIEDYFRSFPKLRENEKAHEYEADLIKSFYKGIANEVVHVMPVLRPVSNTLKVEFCPPNARLKQFYFIDFTDQDRSILINSPSICIALTKIGMNIYNIPKVIVQSFSEAGVPLEKLTPEAVNEFLRNNSEIVMKGKEAISLKYSVFEQMKTVKSLLQYCKKDENFRLNGVSLLVTEDGALRRFDDSKHVYYDEISTLFPSRKHMTLHPKLRMTLSKYKDELSGALRKFTLDDFSRIMGEELNQIFKTSEEIVIGDVNRLLPTIGWLYYAWVFLQKRFKEWELQHIMEEAERTAKIRNQGPVGSIVESRTPKEMGIVPVKFLYPISRWCLFPVERHIQGESASRQCYLMRINKASNAVNIGTGMTDIIDELGLPVPSSLFRDNHEISRMLMDMATHIENVNSFIDALTVECKRGEFGFCRLSAYTAKELLRFLSRKTKDIDIIRQESLKNLPVWEDLSGELKTVPSAVNCYLICYDMPKAGTTLLQDRYNVLLLKKHSDMPNIYKVASLKDKNDTEVYCNFILKHFAELQSKDRFAHLSYLKDKFMKSCCELEADLEEKLRNTKIIEKNGVLSFARDFYDPETQLFAVMLKENNFPPNDYRNVSWLTFLKFLGLIWKVSSELFCSFANGISQIENKEERRLKSEALIEHFRQSDTLKEDEHFLHRLSSMPFLIADKLNEQLSKIYPGKNEEGLLCFNGCVLHSEKNIWLSWTIENTIPLYASKSPTLNNLPYDKLSAKHEVCYRSAIRNLENISKSDLLRNVAEGVKAYPKGQKFEDIFDIAYEFFHKRHAIGDEDVFPVLCKIPMILVNDNKISTARRVTMEKEFDMPPYLFSMPLSLGKFVDLFKKIGMSEKPTIYQLTKVLDGLFAVSNGNPLEPNEANNCLKVILRMMDVIIEEGFPSDIILLPLPGCYGKEKSTVCLFQSQDLVYFDNTHLDKRLINLNMPRLHLEFMREQLSANEDKLTQAAVFRFITNLPLVLQPKISSVIVKEVLIDSVTIPNVGFIRDLQNAMKCIEFAGCMIRLLKHQEDRSSDDSKVSFQKISELLPKIQVITKEAVCTVLVLQSNDVRVEGSEYESEVFVTINEERLEIYISSSLYKKSDIIAAVAAALASFCQFKDPKLSPLLNALLEKDQTEMHEYLDKQRIRRDYKEIDALGGQFYSLGEYVPIELHCLLNNDISNFNVGDYVAYELEDPGLDDKDGGPVYIYAKVVEFLAKHGSKDFYKIDIGMEEPIDVHKSELYGFYRPENLQKDSEDEDLSIEEVKESIRKELEEAFKQGEEYAKRIIKRLWLKWHPDKNIGNEEFCTEIFKFIQSEAARLRGDSNDNFWNSESSFKRYRQRGSTFCQRRREFHETGRRRYSWSNGYWRAPNYAQNPQPGEAKRWFRQAKFDLDAARNDLIAESFEWVCFKCHQATEKFLRSAVYMKSARNYNHHQLQVIASATTNDLLKTYADQIESLLTGSAALRYPNKWCYPSIPHDKYDINKAEQALRIAENIFKEVDKLVNKE